MTPLRRFVVMTPVLTTLSGCGAVVPSISEPWEPTYPGNPKSDPPTPPVTASGQLEFEIKRNIYCELRQAVKDADLYKVDTTRNGKTVRTPYLPDSWGAQLALSMEVDDNSALNPGVSFITPFSNMQSRTIGLGATVSSTATRIDKFNSYYTIKYLRSDQSQKEFCAPDKDPFLISKQHFEPSRSSLMTGELGIEKWLIDANFVNRAIPSFGSSSASPPATQSTTSAQSLPSGAQSSGNAEKAQANSGPGQQDAISIEIKFIVVTSGNVNPSWKLVRISADTGSNPLFSAGRTRTHDMILTIGPRSPATDYANLALQIGQAVGSANRAASLNP